MRVSDVVSDDCEKKSQLRFTLERWGKVIHTNTQKKKSDSFRFF